MNEFQQYVPRFVDVRGVDRVVVEFETLDQLLSIEHVKFFSTQENFSHFCLSDKYLMAVLDNGFKWYVVGTIKYPTLVDLPKWEGAKYRDMTDKSDL